MISKDTILIVTCGTIGLATSVAEKSNTVFGSQTEFLHMILYSFIGGCIAWAGKELMEYLKRKKNEKYIKIHKLSRGGNKPNSD